MEALYYKHQRRDQFNYKDHFAYLAQSCLNKMEEAIEATDDKTLRNVCLTGILEYAPGGWKSWVEKLSVEDLGVAMQAAQVPNLVILKPVSGSKMANAKLSARRRQK